MGIAKEQPPEADHFRNSNEGRALGKGVASRVTVLLFPLCTAFCVSYPLDFILWLSGYTTSLESKLLGRAGPDEMLSDERTSEMIAFYFMNLQPSVLHGAFSYLMAHNCLAQT